MGIGQMGKSFFKSIFREFSETPGRFIAIFLIIALGAGFFAGLRAASPSMKRTADFYFERTGLSDIQIISEFGLTEADIRAVRGLEGVDAAVGVRFTDVFGRAGGDALLLRMFGLPDSGVSGSAHVMNQVTLTEGRMPVGPDECLIDQKVADVRLGERLDLGRSDNSTAALDMLGTHTFTVVGKCYSPRYLSFARGNTNIGNGRVDGFFYVPDTAFSLDLYTEISVSLSGAEGLSAFSDAYQDEVDRVRGTLKVIAKEQGAARLEDLRTAAAQKITDAETDLARMEVDGRGALEAAKTKIDDAQQALDRGEAEYQAKADALAAANAQIEAKRQVLGKARADYEAGQAAADARRADLVSAGDALSALRAGLGKERSRVGALKAQLEFLLGLPTPDPQMVGSLQAQVAAGEAAIAEAERRLSEEESRLVAGAGRLADAYAELKAAAETIAAGEQALAAAVKEAGTGMAALSAARAQLDAGAAELRASRTDYAAAELDATATLAEARASIEDARASMAAVKAPEWRILDRNANPGYAGFAADTDRINSLSVIVPLFMYIVATLVCLTTMTRMVEEQRMLIGTLKALGYSRIAIIFKYFFFALLISLLGGLAGIVCGLQIFPRTIWRAYTIMYTMDPMVLSVHKDALMIALLGGMAATTLATVLACFSGLRSAAAELMRPRAPKPGKRVPLERVTFLWQRIRFSYKVTIRNLFRYKKRFFMAIIGVAGCTALLLSGFGLRDSIGGMIERQFSRVSHYTITVALADAGSALDDTDLNRLLKRSGKSVYISQTTVKASAGGRSSQDMIVWLNVPEDPKVMRELITLRNRQSGEMVPFPDDGTAPSVVVSEKLAIRLGLVPGDRVTFGAADGKQVTARVSGIMENYFNNYIYISPVSYKALFEKAPAYNQVLLYSESGDVPPDQLMKSLIDCEGVASALSMTQLKEQLENMISSFDQVVWVIILVAAFLALVVLYNLTNINVMERSRELATLKVLGFYRREVLSYISRETACLTLVGIALGLVGGIWLHTYVVRSVEINDVMFVREIQAASYMLAGVFTLLCAIVINLAMRPKIRRIDPVLSLKSAE